MVSLFSEEDMPPLVSSTAFSKLLKDSQSGDPKSVLDADRNAKVTVTISESGTDKEKDLWSKESCTTPTATEYRIPEMMTCPPAPRKGRGSSNSRLPSARVKDYFVPPNLEAIFALDKGSKFK